MAMTKLTKENFEAEVLTAQETVMVEFSAPWCGYCRRIAPAIEALAQSLDGRVKVGTIDIDEQPELTGRYEVETIPSLIVFQGGKAVGEALVAPQSRGRIEEWLRENGAL